MTKEQLLNCGLLDICQVINKHIGSIANCLGRDFSKFKPEEIILSEIDLDLKLKIYTIL